MVLDTMTGCGVLTNGPAAEPAAHEESLGFSAVRNAEFVPLPIGTRCETFRHADHGVSAVIGMRAGLEAVVWDIPTMYSRGLQTTTTAPIHDTHLSRALGESTRIYIAAVGCRLRWSYGSLSVRCISC